MELALQLPDATVSVAIRERLGLARVPCDFCPHIFNNRRVCNASMRAGAHVHCCSGTLVPRTRFRHNPLVREWYGMLLSAGRSVAEEQRDPTMGAAARLDVVEFASAVGGAASYDVSVVTPLRDDASFIAACARTPGHAAATRHRYKLTQQYRHRLPGAVLVPLVVEIGGRWHDTVPPLVRRLAREYVARTPALAGSAASVTGRWAARLSAALLRGNAAVMLAARCELPTVARSSSPPGAYLPQCVPAGDSAYELLVR